jgi:TPP-dependent pyruvate/acetoin dehydrogenase alpha subunit
MTPDKKTQLWMYETMVKSRYFEECIAAIYLEGKKPIFDLGKGTIPGEMHLSRGQEPPAVAVCAHLNARDVLTAGHRLHHFAIAKGVRLPAMTAEIFGKSSGLSGGRGGHMHIIDATCNFAASGIICEGMAPAAGAALAFKMRGENRVGVSVIGEGGANAGVFHETLNLAALWKLPFVCVIEDNSWAVSVAKSTSTAVPRNDVRAAAYGIPGEYVAGNDPYEIYRVVGEAVQRARTGGGPTLIEVETWRYDGHFQGDPEHYLAKGEKEAKLARDPIPAMRTRMLTGEVTTAAELDALEKRAHAAVDEAIRFARESPMPVPEDALTRVYA